MSDTPEQTVALAARHILVVDDETALAELLREVLLVRGYRVSAFTNPQAALAAYQHNPLSFDALITDQTMPGLSGLDLIREIRHINPLLPVILASGYSNVIDAASAGALGVHCFFQKPYQVQLLVEQLASLLRSHRQAQQ